MLDGLKPKPSPSSNTKASHSLQNDLPLSQLSIFNDYPLSQSFRSKPLKLSKTHCSAPLYRAPFLSSNRRFSLVFHPVKRTFSAFLFTSLIPQQIEFLPR
jgi:hypothetical protein